MFEIEPGWRFFSADFSSTYTAGVVTLERDHEAKTRWFLLPPEVLESEDCPPLYINGRGVTLEDALEEACILAHHAKGV